MSNIFKQTIALLGLLFVANVVLAQAPQGIPYQGVARNSSGVLLASQAISVRFTIHDATAGGTVVYQETFNPTTTALGLFSVNVGMGTVVSGTFSSINWGTNAKYMQVEMDPTGGSSYVDMGTQQMMSVPYSLYSNNGVAAGTTTGDMLYWNGSSWVRVAAGTTGQVLVVSGGVPSWAPTTTLTIGQSYGGGIIAYLLQSGDPGYDPTVQHGLIAAIADQSSGCQWDPAASPGFAAAGGTSIGTGKTNTNNITVETNYFVGAAYLASSYSGGGFSDWYLPSSYELYQLYINRVAIGGFSSADYWSSSEFNIATAWTRDFSNGTQGNNLKSSSGTIHVRAVRTF